MTVIKRPVLTQKVVRELSLPVVPHDAAPWMVDGLCAQTDPEEFFPEKGGKSWNAKRICAACPVQQTCLDWAMEHEERFGIWGGLSERERRALRGPVRVCGLEGCSATFPVIKSGRTKYCSRDHSREAMRRRLRIKPTEESA